MTKPHISLDQMARFVVEQDNYVRCLDCDQPAFRIESDDTIAVLAMACREHRRNTCEPKEQP